MKMYRLMLTGILAATSLVPTMYATEFLMATMDTRSLVESSDDMTTLRDSITKNFTAKREEIVKSHEKLKDDIAAFQKNMKTMKKATKEKKEKALMARQQKLAGQEREFQADLYKAQDSGMKKIMDKVKRATKVVAEKSGYSVILPNNDAMYSNCTDVTDQVKEALKSLK